jgi:hypothetical protein
MRGATIRHNKAYENILIRAADFGRLIPDEAYDRV